MGASISLRHERWDATAERYLERRLSRLARALGGRGYPPAPVHLSIEGNGHGLTECRGQVTLGGTVLHAHASSHSKLTALRTLFDELEHQIDRHSQRAARRAHATVRSMGSSAAPADHAEQPGA